MSRIEGGGFPRPPRWTLAFALIVMAHQCGSQENAGMTIPNSLLECYSNATLYTRANLPIMGMSQLIEIIRKVEKWPYTTLGIKDMALQLTQRFRMDGIKRDPRTMAADGVIPFTPAGPEFFRHRILLTQLIPGNAYNFPNDSLSSEEKCALHFMLSSTTDDIARGDEDSVCSYVKNYENEVVGISGSYYGGGGYNGYGGYQGGYGSGTVYNRNRGRQPSRGPRNTRDAKPGIDSDVEIIDPTTLASDSTDTRHEQHASMSNYLHSRCPIQSGVVWTRWGAVSGGSVIAGLAAGLMPQTVTVQTLSAYRPRSRYYQQGRNPNLGISEDSTGSVDNKWASTISGDLAVVALMQGPVDRDNMAVGLAGGWNSTLAPRYYFMSSDSDGAMTDAEIRGDIDGLVMGSQINDWANQFSGNLKLSQILDMYYSERGVFSRDVRACSRRDRLSDVASTQALQAQTESFAKVFQRLNTLTVNMENSVILDLADRAVSKLQSYIPSSLNDPTCTVSTTDLIVQPQVDVIVALDTTWQYSTIHPALGYLMEKINAGMYGSNVTVLNARDGTVVFNSSYPLLDWYTDYPQSLHESSAQGTDVLASLGAAMQVLRMLDSHAFRRQTLKSRGKAILFVMPNTLGSYDQQRLWGRMANFKQIYPDVDLLVLTQGNKNAFSVITNDTNNDVFTLSVSDPGSAIRSLATRLAKVPRRIRNTNCDADWVQARTGNSEFIDYVEPLGINYYRIPPNNFFRSTQARVRVQTQGGGTLTVCYSRSLMRPNATQGSGGSSGDSTCKQLSSNSLSIELGTPCDSSSYIKDCGPLYLSVAAAQASSTGVGARCIDNACRFPDMIKFTVIAENMGCWNAATSALSSAVMIVAALAMSMRVIQ